MFVSRLGKEGRKGEEEGPGIIKGGVNGMRLQFIFFPLSLSLSSFLPLNSL